MSLTFATDFSILQQYHNDSTHKGNLYHPLVLSTYFMFYPSEAYFKQFESFKGFLHFMIHFPLEFIQSNLLPCILEGFTYGDIMWATHNPSYIILHSYELVYNLVSYHVSVLHCITSARM